MEWGIQFEQPFNGALKDFDDMLAAFNFRLREQSESPHEFVPTRRLKPGTRFLEVYFWGPGMRDRLIGGRILATKAGTGKTLLHVKARAEEWEHLEPTWLLLRHEVEKNWPEVAETQYQYVAINNLTLTAPDPLPAAESSPADLGQETDLLQTNAPRKEFEQPVTERLTPETFISAFDNFWEKRRPATNCERRRGRAAQIRDWNQAQQICLTLPGALHPPPVIGELYYRPGARVIEVALLIEHLDKTMPLWEGYKALLKEWGVLPVEEVLDTEIDVRPQKPGPEGEDPKTIIAILDEWNRRRGKETQEAFCARKGVGVSTLRVWKGKRKRGEL